MNSNYDVEKESLLAYKTTLQEILAQSGWAPSMRPYATSSRNVCWARGLRELNVKAPLHCNDYKDDFALHVWSSEHGQYMWKPQSHEDDAGGTFAFRSYNDLPYKVYKDFDEWQTALLEFIQ